MGTPKGLQPFVHKIFMGIENVYAKGTNRYDDLLIGGTESFYGGTRNEKLVRFNALLVTIGGDAALAAVKAIVLSVRDNIQAGVTAQNAEVSNVNTDKASVKVVVFNAYTGLWVVYFMLMIIYVLTPALAIAFFPMEFIYKAAKQKIKTVFVFYLYTSV